MNGCLQHPSLTCQDVLQRCCQLVRVEGHDTVVVIPSGYQHRRVLTCATCRARYVVEWAIFDEPTKLLLLLYIPIICHPGMTCMPGM